MESFKNNVEGVTVQSVENFYKFKNKIKVIEDKESLIESVKEEGIAISDQSSEMQFTELRKTILNAYLGIHFKNESSKND